MFLHEVDLKSSDDLFGTLACRCVFVVGWPLADDDDDGGGEMCTFFHRGGEENDTRDFFLAERSFFRNLHPRNLRSIPQKLPCLKGPVAFSKAHHFGCPAVSFRGCIWAIPRSPIMKGIPAYSLLVKGFFGVCSSSVC